MGVIKRSMSDEKQNSLYVLGQVGGLGLGGEVCKSSNCLCQ